MSIRVLETKIKRFKALTDFEMFPEGQNCLLVGDNEVGKSTVLQFLQIALGNKDLVPPNAEGEGYVVLDKNGEKWVVNLKFKDGKPVVVLVAPDNMKDSRRSALAAFAGAVDLNPLQFLENARTEKGRRQQVTDYRAQLSQADQAELARLEAHITTNEQERLELGRENTKLKGFVETHALRHLPDVELQKLTPTDTAAVMGQLEQANKHNEMVGRGEEKRKGYAETFDKAAQSLKEAEEALARAQDAYRLAKDQLANADKWLQENPRQPVDQLQATLAQAEETNKRATAAADLLVKRAILKDDEMRYGEYTSKIEGGRQALEDAIKDIQGPVADLRFTADHLVWRGQIVHPEYMAESAMIELAVHLKHAENPEAPLFIERTESLGAKRWAGILAFAKERNVQVIAEEVRRGQEQLTVEIMEA